MRSTYSPYPQLPATNMEPILQGMRERRAAIEAATEAFNEYMTEHLPGLMRHYTTARPVLAAEIKELRSGLQTTNNQRAQNIERLWTETMTDIERKRAAYHADLNAEKDKARIKREEDNSFGSDTDTGELFFMRHMPDGTKKRTIVERDGPHWKRFGARAGG